jgi:hypothetical protein
MVLRRLNHAKRKTSADIEAQALTNIEPRRLLDLVGRERAITKAEDSESWVWIVLDIVFDFPKLVLMSLSTSIRCWLRKRKITSPVR